MWESSGIVMGAVITLGERMCGMELDSKSKSHRSCLMGLA